MGAQAPAPSRAHAHTIPGERLLKDSDSRNNKGSSRIAGVLIRVHFHFDFQSVSLFLHTPRSVRAGTCSGSMCCSNPSGTEDLELGLGKAFGGWWCFKPARLKTLLVPLLHLL